MTKSMTQLSKVLCAFVLLVSLPAHAGKGPDSFADLAEKLLPAVVNISTSQKIERNNTADLPMPNFPEDSPFEEFFKDFFGEAMPHQAPRERDATSLGSGFVIDADEGLIVTNNHVIMDADEITVTFHDDSTVKAEVLGIDKKTDLALLKVDTDADLVAVDFGNSDAMRVGEWVMAIGNPFGLGGTVTVGIISARARDINAGPYDDFIQTDASINRGNSGGPMFNVQGQVIGVNTAIFSPSGGSVGIGFAIPSNLVKHVVTQLREFGHTRRGWLGVRIQTVTDEIAESLGLEEPKGALVASVTEGGPAQVAGIKAGDVIVEFDNQEVQEMRRLPRIVAETHVGKEVDVTIWRREREVSVKVSLGELEEAEEKGILKADDKPEKKKPTTETVDSLGLSLTAITKDMRATYGLEDSLQGVLVLKVSDDSDAALRDVRPGDVIVEVNQETVKKPEDIASQVEQARKEEKRSVLLLINRRGDMRWVALKIDNS